MNEIYVVTQDKDPIGRKENILVTNDPDEAKQVCDEEYYEEDAPIGKRKHHTFIEVWSVGSNEPKYVTRENPGR